MGKEIAFENGRISDSQGLVTLTLDRVILHTSCVTHQPLPHLHTKFRWNRRNLWWMDGWTYAWTFETHFIRL